MFGLGKKSKAVNVATEAMRPFISSLQIVGDLPRGFWEDPYVLGFMHGAIGVFAKLSSGGTLAGGDLGMVSMQVFENIANEYGQVEVRRIVDFSEQGNPDFMLGMDKGSKCVLVTYGAKGFEDDPDVLSAQKLAGSMGAELGGTQESNIAGALQHMLFYEEVRRRLETGSEEA